MQKGRIVKIYKSRKFDVPYGSVKWMPKIVEKIFNLGGPKLIRVPYLTSKMDAKNYWRKI